jgi:hypothetical protein
MVVALIQSFKALALLVCSRMARVSPRLRNTFQNLDLHNDQLKIDIYIVIAKYNFLGMINESRRSCC